MTNINAGAFTTSQQVRYLIVGTVVTLDGGPLHQLEFALIDSWVEIRHGRECCRKRCRRVFVVCGMIVGLAHGGAQ